MCGFNFPLLNSLQKKIILNKVKSYYLTVYFKNWSELYFYVNKKFQILLSKIEILKYLFFVYLVLDTVLNAMLTLSMW